MLASMRACAMRLYVIRVQYVIRSEFVILGFIAQSANPRFAQGNPRMVHIRTLRLTYIHVHCMAYQVTTGDC